MSKRIYLKPPLSFTDQLAMLKNRGLIVENQGKALNYLSEISYYRLSAYFLPYQTMKDRFNPGTTFQQIIDTYSFDRELRLLVFDCIERIEIAIRTQIIYCMATRYNDSHWQDNKKLFLHPFYNKVGNLVDPYTNIQSIISRAKTARAPEIFIRHYINNYSMPSNPPSWMCLELLTMGELSRLYCGLKNKSDKRRIAAFFDVHPTVFTSWTHTLTYVRNLCAHHSRLWNRNLAIEPDKIKRPVGKWVNFRFENNKRIFYFISILKYLLQRANPGNGLTSKLQKLFDKYTAVPVKYMGIPSDEKGNLLEWRNEPLWQTD